LAKAGTRQARRLDFRRADDMTLALFQNRVI
jgi:hypothetical protein